MHPDNQKLLERLDRVTEILSQMNKERFAEQYLDESELCSLFSISRKTAQAMRDSGELRYAPVGKRIFYLNSDIEKMFLTKLNKPKPRKKSRVPRSKRFKPGKRSNGWDLKGYGKP